MPPQRPRTGHPNHDHRTVVNGILWVWRTGAPWRDLPKRYGKWTTVYSRFRRWKAAGWWERGEVDWEIHFVDGSIVRAHQHAATPKKHPRDRSFRAQPGGLSTKIHLRCHGKGKPITFILTPGQQHELTVAEQLLEQGAMRRGKKGRVRLRPKWISGDKGYSCRQYRQYLWRRGIRMTIPRKKNEQRTGPFDRELYRQRNLVERLFNHLKQFRRVANRYDKRVDNYAALLTIARFLLWL